MVRIGVAIAARVMEGVLATAKFNYKSRKKTRDLSKVFCNLNL
jgi:hypothetical protein